VVIDVFSYSPHAQIIHVRHDGQGATSRTLSSFTDHGTVLDDLGAKASDLLQANGIVWLEGPSDRIYFNRWVELYSEGELREHRDYECAFFGGSILKHFEAAEPKAASDEINILRINRNSILITDSDKTGPRKRLKQRVKRMRDSMEKMGAHIWITAAKEIENYIPADAMEKVFGKSGLAEVGQYERFFYTSQRKNEKGYWQRKGLGGSFDKVKVASEVVAHLTRENLDGRFDLEDEMAKICEIVRRWNFTRE